MANLNNLIEVAQLLEVQDLVHTDTKSNYVDLYGYQGCVLGVMVGTLTGVDGSNYLTPILEESDSTADSGFSAATDVTSSPAFSKIDSTSEDAVTQWAVYTGNKRYVRVKLDYTGTGISAGYVGVFAILGKALREPPAAPTTGTAA